MPKRESTANQIYAILRQRIITCEYDNNVILNENQLAKEFNVSRTPIREALHRLESKHFISLTKAGAQILPMDILLLRNCYESKNVLLTGIAVIACERITAKECQELENLISLPTRELDYRAFLDWYDSVQRLINKSTRNEMFQAIMDSTFDNLFRFLAYCVINGFCNRAAIEDTLKDFARAIMARDKALAIKCAGRHIDQSMSIHPPSKITSGVEREWMKIAEITETTTDVTIS